jgi:hypothetical protein
MSCHLENQLGEFLLRELVYSCYCWFQIYTGFGYILTKTCYISYCSCQTTNNIYADNLYLWHMLGDSYASCSNSILFKRQKFIKAFMARVIKICNYIVNFIFMRRMLWDSYASCYVYYHMQTISLSITNVGR